MTDPTTTAAQNPAEIERDIRHTQDQMSRTVDRIGDQLTPRNLINSLLDKAEDNNIDARYLLDGARRNPIALAMIAGAAIWLISDSDAKLSRLRSGDADKAPNNEDTYHRDYVSHMERVDWQPEDNDATFQRRRDIARANYFMLERGHEEDEGSFRQRLDEMTDKFREKRHDWGDSVRDTGNAAYQCSTATLTKAQTAAKDAYLSNPLIGGLVAAAVGAIFGTALPHTRTEDEQLSGVGDAARDLIGGQTDKLVSAAREKKDELLTQVEHAGQARTDSPKSPATTIIEGYSATSSEPVL